MIKLKNNLFCSVEQLCNKNVYVLKSIYNLNQVNGLTDLLENENFNFQIGNYEVTLFEPDINKLKQFIDGCTLM